MSQHSAARFLANPHQLLIRLSLGLALAFGFSLGVYLIFGFAFGLPLAASTPALMQVHGQVQAFGFVAMFIMAVGVQLIPRFHSSRLDRPWLISIGGLVLALGITLRVLAQPFDVNAAPRALGLVVSGILEFAGVDLAVYAFARVIRGSVQPGLRGAAVLLPVTMAGSLVSALVLNLFACLELARGALVVPFAQDEALLHLELWGFASTMVLAVAGRVFPGFLLLQPTRERMLPYALAFWAVGSFGTPLVWLTVNGAPLPRAMVALAQLAGGCLYVLALRLYETPVRPSGMPHVTDPTRRWARLAFALLLCGRSRQLRVGTGQAVGLPPLPTVLSAARHALAQGFLLPGDRRHGCAHPAGLLGPHDPSSAFARGDGVDDAGGCGAALRRGAPGWLCARVGRNRVARRNARGRRVRRVRRGAVASDGSRARRCAFPPRRVVTNHPPARGALCWRER